MPTPRYLRNLWPRRALVIWLPVTMWGGACERSADETPSGAPATTTAPTTSATTAAASRTFAKPFVGVIRVRQTFASMNTADVEYTIDAQRIRREKIDHVYGRLEATPQRSGVVIDLKTGRAIQYKTYIDRRYAIEQTLDEYDKDASGALDAPYGLAFFALREAKSYSAANTPNSDMVGGVACDVLRLEPPPVAVVVHHARDIVVDRRLLERVDPGLPVEVTGFPLRVHVGKAHTAGAEAWAELHGFARELRPKPSRVEEMTGRVLRATTQAATRTAAAVLDVKSDVVEITEGSVDDVAFKVPDGFTMASSLSEFHSKTSPSGGGFDLD